MPKDETPADVNGAFARMREISDKLKEPAVNTDQAALDARYELIDELMTIDMALGPFRRAMGQKAKDAKDAEMPDESST